MAGLTLALALQQGGLHVCVIEQTPYETQANLGYDGRASAIAYGCFRQWDALGVGEALRPYACRMNEIMVTDGPLPGPASTRPSPFFLNFAASEIGERTGHEPLGYMVENRQTRRVLHEAVTKASISLFVPSKITEWREAAHGVTVQLNTGETLFSPLLVSSEGRSSPLRTQAGIRTTGWDYGQSALVCTLELEKPHNHIAYEVFLSSGPFAILPLRAQPEKRDAGFGAPCATKDDNCVCIVWSETHAKAQALKTMPEDRFMALMRQCLGEFTGTISLKGERFVYPLSLSLAEDMVKGRLALVGDSAHGIHPIAGQGLNLGLRDVAALSEVLIEAARLGEDIGAKLVLERYGQWRRFAKVSTSVVMDGFVHLFSNNNPIVRPLRDLGMGIVNRLGPLRRTIIEEAGANLGALPRLLRGEPV